MWMDACNWGPIPFGMASRSGMDLKQGIHCKIGDVKRVGAEDNYSPLDMPRQYEEGREEFED